MDEKYMRQAIELARRGEGFVNPNPPVGCVVVKNGRVAAEGWHERYGGYHAERNALTRCEEDLRGAELYVTLEPCCHTGKTPPCTDIIIERGIGTVYVGSDDPNPLVAGHGVEILREAGITVHTHVLKEACDRLNEIFFHYITTKRPFVAMKYAMTLDGRIALPGGKPAPITGPEAREHLHRLRRRYASILVGIGTVLSDDPMLNVRLEEPAGVPETGGNPTRIALDSHLRIPLTSKLVQTAEEIPTIVVHTVEEEERRQALEARGVRTMHVAADGAGRTDMDELFTRLAEEGLDSVLVEGGSHVHGCLLEHPEWIDRVYAYIAPSLFGGDTSPSPAGGAGVEEIGVAPRLSEVEYVPLGEDMLVTGRLK